MNIDPGISIVVSFIGFGWIFFKKIYPTVINYIDGYIDSVKQQVHTAEKLRDDAYEALKIAYTKKDDINEMIVCNQKRSQERIQKLHQENEKYLAMLRKQHELSLNNKLNSEFLHQKHQLIQRLSDTVIEKLLKEISDGECQPVLSVDKSDLLKLLGKQR